MSAISYFPKANNSSFVAPSGHIYSLHAFGLTRFASINFQDKTFSESCYRLDHLNEFWQSLFEFYGFGQKLSIVALYHIYFASFNRSYSPRTVKRLKPYSPVTFVQRSTVIETEQYEITTQNQKFIYFVPTQCADLISQVCVKSHQKNP